MRLLLSATLSAMIVCACGSLANGQGFEVQTNDGAVTASGSIGVIGIDARKYVFQQSGASDMLSLLVFQSAAPLLNTAVEVELPNNWSVLAATSLGMAGNSFMTDSDWLFEVDGTPNMGNWTHQSRHPDTSLEWYFNGALQAAYTVETDGGADLRFHGGFEYTDVQWSSTGGSYVYSVDDFRDAVGDFDPVEVITYRQQLPSIVVGANAIVPADAWTFDLGVKAGLTFAAGTFDHHRLRNLIFDEHVGIATLVGASAKASYALNESLDLVLSGNLDHMPLARSSTNYYTIDTGASLGGSTDASGASLTTVALRAGLSGRF